MDDGFELFLIAHFGFAVEISKQFAFIHGCGYLVGFLDYSPEYHRIDIFVERHSCSGAEGIRAFRLVRSSVQLLVGDQDLEEDGAVDRQPVVGIERQIIPVPFEILGSVEILFPIEIYNDTILIHSFADVLDVEDEILIQCRSLCAILGIDEIDIGRHDIGFAFRHLCEIEIEASCKRISLIVRHRFGTGPQDQSFLAYHIALEIDLEKRFGFRRYGEGRILYLQDDLIIFYFGAGYAVGGTRQDAENLHDLRIIIHDQGEFRDFLSLRRKQDVGRIGAAGVEFVGRLESHVRI